MQDNITEEDKAEAEEMWKALHQILGNCTARRVGNQIRTVIDGANEEKLLALFTTYKPYILLSAVITILDMPLAKSVTDRVAVNLSATFDYRQMMQAVGTYEYKMSAMARDFVMSMFGDERFSEAQAQTLYRVLAAELEQKLKPIFRTLPNFEQLLGSFPRSANQQYFLMSPPVYGVMTDGPGSTFSHNFDLIATNIDNRYRWEKVKMTIEAAGGIVLVVDGSLNEVRGSYTRDQTIILKDSVIATGFRKSEKVPAEANLGINPLMYRREINKLLETLGFGNFQQLPRTQIDGGNVLTHRIGPNELVFLGGRGGESLVENHQHLQSVLPPHTVLPIGISSEHSRALYHLDLIMSVNRDTFMIFPEGFEFGDQLRIVEQASNGNLIRISQEDAYRGATNNLLVGNNLIMPFASRELQASLNARGLNPITPESLGMEPNSFSYGAAHVHCMTLELPAERLSLGGRAEVKRMLAAQSSAYRE